MKYQIMLSLKNSNFFVDSTSTKFAYGFFWNYECHFNKFEQSSKLRDTLYNANDT
jgi:hypothetical protein